MKRLSLAALCALLSSSISWCQVLLEGQALLDHLMDKITSSQRVLDWAEQDEYVLWSVISEGQGLAHVGYQIDGTSDQDLSRDMTEMEWEVARTALLEAFLKESQRYCGLDLSMSDVLIQKSHDRLPFMVMKICDIALISWLRDHVSVRYIEPYSYTAHTDQLRSGEGCSDYSQILNTADYEEVSPDAISSWHHKDHKIDSAWTKSDNGKGIWISIMDTGISEDNPKYNGEFDEGESSGRSIEKNGYYNNDGWADQCGHGTAMIGLAVAPKGYDDSPAGVAYRANLVSNRVSNDVVINAGAEINALANAITDAADDSRVDIISMSLGDIFSHGPIEDAIIYAHEKEKLIFAAAGTSTFFTNWFGVTFPGSMDETLAITGVVEGTSFSECDNCHYGDEVDLVVYMERSSSGNTCVTTANDNVNSDYVGYVGGSSAATATMAGIAGLIWSDEPDMTRDEMINRLIKASSHYPNKTSDFGWGAIDVCEAVADSLGKAPCRSGLSNEVILEITGISFPSTDDGFGDVAEWVVILEESSYYFEVPESGGEGNPITYNNEDPCDLAPIRINLGSTVCGQSSINIDLETHEDDGFSSECEYNAGDDDRTISVETITFGGSQFIQSTSNGDFVFSYRLYCTPDWQAAMVDDSPKCPGDSVQFEASPSGYTEYRFFLDANQNGGIDIGELLQAGSNHLYVSNTIADGDHIGVVINETGGCTDTVVSVVQMISPDYAGSNRLVGVLAGYHDYETNDDIESVQVLSPTAVVDYDAARSVSLFEGFEVQQGAIFEAFIDGCNDGGGGTHLQEEEGSGDR